MISVVPADELSKLIKQSEKAAASILHVQCDTFSHV